MRNDNLNFWNLLSIIILFTQIVNDSLQTAPFSGESTKVIGAFLMVLNLICTGLYQYKSEFISNKSLWATILLFLLYVLGGISDYLNLFPLSAETEGIVRWALNIIITALNITSKLFYNQNQIK